ncbi:MAG TPA: chloride channel protein [Acetobacteraceae bacterium]|nr:chloride channel protein [Acetobacteraceae bacterium]
MSGDFEGGALRRGEAEAPRETVVPRDETAPHAGGHGRPGRLALPVADPQSLRRLRRMPLISPRLWKRRLVFWVGAVMVSLVAIVFARAADWAGGICHQIAAWQPLSLLVISPAALAFSLWLTRVAFPGAQGSGIPQTMAALHLSDQRLVDRVLSLRVAIGKIMLTLVGLMAGASIGREGPTVQISAAMMHAMGKLMRLPRQDLARALVLAGGAAGISAAFNTPLAGIMFAIEELSHSFESRTSGTVMTAVIISGITTLALVGSYTYFGVTSAVLNFGAGWIAVPLCAVCGGLAGGAFSWCLVQAARGLPGRSGRFVLRHPIVFAALCGLGVAVIGLISGGATYGTGYAQARGVVEGTAHMAPLFFLLKLASTTISYISGIPGGIFAPSLAVGAGLGQLLARLIPHAPLGAVVLCGMVAYFSGVVQAPITAAIIVMEMTDNQQMTIPLLATSMIAFGASRLICRRPLYGTLAQRFLIAMERGHG